MGKFIQSITLFEVLCLWYAALLGFAVFTGNVAMAGILTGGFGMSLWGRVKGQIEPKDRDHE